MAIGMLGQRYKFDVDQLSFLLDAKLKHCSQIKLKTNCVKLHPMTF